MSRMNFHDEMTPLQARVLFHSERIFRSAGASRATDRARAQWIRDVTAAGMDPSRVTDWTDAQCRQALRDLESCARAAGVANFRNVSTT